MHLKNAWYNFRILIITINTENEQQKMPVKLLNKEMIERPYSAALYWGFIER